ncbi:MAG TPA: NFACT RNA binding domain-containing protein [Capsulimonadaceae bacterium]|nr:NFACT RNA binding domain-containing protein [Capsulimonadaceae bacterium]
MNFDSLILAAVAGELQQTILTGKVERIAQPEALTLVLTIYHVGQHHHILISCEPSASRIYLIGMARKNPPTPPAFCMLLRKYLEGAWVEAVEHPFGYGERVVRLAFLGRDRARYFLWAELMGKHSNLIFTNSAGTILGAMKRVTMEMSRFRQVRAGIAYAPPPRQKGAKIDAFSPIAGNDLPHADFGSREEAREWLMATFSAVSPLMAEETIARLSDPPYTSDTVWYALNDLLNTARLAEWSPVLILDETGLAQSAYPVPLATVPAEGQQRWKSISAALERAYSQLMQESAFVQEKQALLSALRRSRKGRERELIDIEEGLANARRSEDYKETAHLIQANVAALPAGAEEAEVADLYADEPGAVRTIALDPKLTALENAERYFRKYQKARDAQEALLGRKEIVEDALAALTLAQQRLESAQTPEELASASEGAQSQMPRFSPAAAAGKEEPSPFAGYKIRTYTSVDGWEVLVGENSTSNDFLTTKIASPSDIWLHARAIPSAHAIIRTKNRPVAVSAAALRLAAEQVARRSQAKYARLVPVDYTLKKYVRKPRRAAPGEVTYSHEKTLDVTPSEQEK